MTFSCWRSHVNLADLMHSLLLDWHFSYIECISITTGYESIVPPEVALGVLKLIW